jgi:hypothetical protein
MKMKKTKRDTRYPMRGIAISKVATSLFILGTAFMLLRGLITRIVLSDFRFGTDGMREISPMITTTKSRTFQGSLM